jgi:hypothetical protein
VQAVFVGVPQLTAATSLIARYGSRDEAPAALVLAA